MHIVLIYKKNVSIASYTKELPPVEMVDACTVQKSAMVEEAKEEVTK
jgi:hypothetical protein